ncbi:MAG: hypothetical protein DI538_20325 [Azospira oryzae]|nr:MAG: hypothetical protein DI538_20325 [Azospira oryzae]
MKAHLLLILLFITKIASAQYPFEKFPPVEYKEFKGWKVYRKADRVHYTLAIPAFFNNKDTLTVQLTSLGDSSLIRLFRNKAQIQKMAEPMFFVDLNVLHQVVKTMDMDHDQRADLKLVIPYLGNGIAALNVRVIYLFQKPDGSFTKIAYLDKEGAHLTERDFDSDGVFEIITMTLKDYGRHNYWTYNIYHFKDGELQNQNERFSYPIMIQYLYKNNYKVTDKISKEKMKTFGDLKPLDYSKK